MLRHVADPEAAPSVDENTEIDECCICLATDFTMVGCTARCAARFHPPCLYKWLEQHGTCPMCREPLSANMFEDFAAGCHVATATMLYTARYFVTLRSTPTTAAEVEATFFSWLSLRQSGVCWQGGGVGACSFFGAPLRLISG